MPDLSGILFLGIASLATATSTTVAAEVTAPATDPSKYITLGGAAIIVVGVLWAAYVGERKALLKAKDDQIENLRNREKAEKERADAAEKKLLEFLQQQANEAQAKLDELSGSDDTRHSRRNHL